MIQEWKKKKKLTSGAIQYGLPLNESIEAAEVICSRKIKSQKIRHNLEINLNINYLLKCSRLLFFIPLKSYYRTKNKTLKRVRDFV